MNDSKQLIGSMLQVGGAAKSSACAGRLRAGVRRLFACPASRQGGSAPLERPEVILAAFLVLATFLMAGADYWLGLWMQSFPSHLLGLSRTITDLGEGVQVLVLSGVILIVSIFVPVARLRRRAVVGINAVTAAAAFVFLSVAGGGTTALLLKYAIGRARPEALGAEGYLQFRPFSMDSDFSAFPSGHSATAGAMAVSLALVFPRLRPIIMPAGVLICVSRQLVGAHWSSDTVMGWGLGVAFTFWVAHVFARRGLVFGYDSDGGLRRRDCRSLFGSRWWLSGQGRGKAARL
ncbi:phosphatase PAP2 family protein [uncultured Devosia sp.]|uniref:phosphatase PAP2 family protein n=1 Tax=uncultured Devosia sp. TaxID=211434 RepID=UPI0035CAAD68